MDTVRVPRNGRQRPDLEQVAASIIGGTDGLLLVIKLILKKRLPKFVSYPRLRFHPECISTNFHRGAARLQGEGENTPKYCYQ